MPAWVDADFSGGSIDVVRVAGRGPIELRIPEDSASDVRQWFAFRVRSGGRPRDIVIGNAGEASFPNAWPGYRAMVTHDGSRWSRAATTYDEGTLLVRHVPRGPAAIYAYFALYPISRLERLLARIRRADHVSVGVVGESVMKRPVPLVGAGWGNRRIWIIARQHPGETPASFVADGLLRRLARYDDDTVRFLLEQATLRIAPLVDVDGAELGNMRTNAAGTNLNRAWGGPDPDEAPEVHALTRAIEETGADLFLDIHADESSAFAFAAGSEGNPTVTDEILGAEAELRSILAEDTREFIDEPGYPIDEPGGAELSCASNQIGERYGCPALTLEMPIKDCGDERVPAGWSPVRAQRFGEALVDVLARWLA